MHEDKVNKEKREKANVAAGRPKTDADYAIQGEYTGMIDGKKLGVQIVALGDGKFDVELGEYESAIAKAKADAKLIAADMKNQAVKDAVVLQA